jgi:hypothetical protein
MRTVRSALEFCGRNYDEDDFQRYFRRVYQHYGRFGIHSPCVSFAEPHAVPHRAAAAPRRSSPTTISIPHPQSIPVPPAHRDPLSLSLPRSAEGYETLADAAAFLDWASERFVLGVTTNAPARTVETVCPLSLSICHDGASLPLSPAPLSPSRPPACGW